nr:unnamed protein product [Callosobruchus analis]
MEDQEIEVIKPAGRLKQFYVNWKNLPFTEGILHWIKGIEIPFLSKPAQISPREKYIPKIPASKLNLYNTEVNNLLAKGAISKCTYAKDQFLSPYFLIKKPDNSYRFVLNLKKLNEFIPVSHFKMENHKTAIKLISPHSYLMKMNLKDAYFLVPIDPFYRKYLSFVINNTLYHFNCLPFGLNIAPLIFTKILKPAVRYLRERGVNLVSYLDDWLFIARSHDECLRFVAMAKDLLENLGFIINTKKCSIRPAKEIEFLGFWFDTISMVLGLPERRIIATQTLLTKLQKKRYCRIREFASLVGTLVSICPAFKYGWLHVKPFEIIKQKELKRNQGNFNRKMEISSILSKEFAWWKNNLSTSGKKFLKGPYTLEIYSDSSKTGWGAHTDDRETLGFWDISERKDHINYLELLAALRGLKALARDQENSDILLRIDNVTAIACINKMGSIKHKNLNRVASELWHWCELKNIYVFASYINTSCNSKADRLSRSKFMNTEFALDPQCFEKIVSAFGSPTIDLFTSKGNAKCSAYIAWYPDPDCIAVDAFTVNWHNYYFYAFPPFSLIGAVLQKIKNDKATGIVVIPYWPTQSWYPSFCDLLIEKPIFFTPRKNLLSSPFRQPHPLYKTLSLVAEKLCGKRWRGGTFPN